MLYLQKYVIFFSRVVYLQVKFQNYIYEVCWKNIESLVGKNTFIDLEIRNTNSLQSKLLGNTHTSPSAPDIVKQFWKTVLGMVSNRAIAFRISSRDSNRVPFSGLFSLGNNQKPQEAMFEWVRSLTNHRNIVFGNESLKSNAQNEWVRYHDGAAKFSLTTDSVVCAARHQEGNKGSPGSTHVLWFLLVVHTDDAEESKKIVDMVILLRICRAFFGLEDDVCCHCDDSILDSGSYS